MLAKTRHKNIKHKIKILRLIITNRQRILLSFLLQNVKTVSDLDFFKERNTAGLDLATRCT